MSLDTRIRAELQRTGGLLTPPESDLEAVTKRGQRRRTTRLVVSGMAVALALVGLGVLAQAIPAEEPVVSPNTTIDSSPGSTTATPTTATVDGMLLFNTLRLGPGPADIFVVHGSEEPRRIVGQDDDATLQRCPELSPDATTLAYAEIGPGGTETHRDRSIVIAAFAGGTVGETILRMPFSPDDFAVCPRWSPDGRFIAYSVLARSASQVVTGELVIHDLEGTPTTLLPAGTRLHEDIAWSPDSTHLAVSIAGLSIAGSGIWLVPVDGGEPTILTAADTLMESGLPIELEWSPDGTELLVNGFEVRTGTADNPVAVRINVAQDLVIDSWPVSLATWSPDGRSIAYYENRDQDLRTVDVASGETRSLAHVEAPNVIVWSPDGEKLAFIGVVGSFLDDEMSLVTVPSDGSSAPTTHMVNGDLLEWASGLSWVGVP
jgi:Tol biopolymer transport system component